MWGQRDSPSASRLGGALPPQTKDTPVTIPNPGWYPNPENGRQDRWWNGVSWSEQCKVRVAEGAGLAGSGANIPAVSHITNATVVADRGRP
ncbi:DUF2510 domain-containing protein [Cryobacterium sp. Sr8]|nr:DUF2510 domain-containing protein [Cryobacterium sp. Sr8]